MKTSYGGVVINQSAQVLLREPKDHFDGYIWTFAKGRPNPGESPEETALREVLEETGVRGCIVGKIPGSFAGSTTNNEYFLMNAVVDEKRFHWETQAVIWAAKEEAEELISKTTNLKGRKRDLSLLLAAFALFMSLPYRSPRGG